MSQAVMERTAMVLKFGTKSVEPELAKLAGEIGWYEQQARKAVTLALQYKLEIGRRLVRAKSLIPHGEFLTWAHEEFGWTPRHIQRHLLLAANAARVSQMAPDTSLRMALVAIQAVEPQRERTEVEREAITAPQRIHIIADFEQGTVNRAQLLTEVKRLAMELGAGRARWTVR